MIQFRKPARGVGDERLQKDSLRHSADADAISLETELLGQADCLAAAVLEELGDVGLGHGKTPQIVYTINIYLYGNPLKGAASENHPPFRTERERRGRPAF